MPKDDRSAMYFSVDMLALVAATYSTKPHCCHVKLGMDELAALSWSRSCCDVLRANKPLRLFNHGKMRRDFTYIDDVTRVVSRLIDLVPA
ncbi:hypothetical protein ABIA96_005448, partial [Bradyrhizobium sp. LB11.1]